MVLTLVDYTQQTLSARLGLPRPSKSLKFYTIIISGQNNLHQKECRLHPNNFFYKLPLLQSYTLTCIHKFSKIPCKYTIKTKK